jgi:hypothetical protein
VGFELEKGNFDGKFDGTAALIIAIGRIKITTNK